MAGKDEVSEAELQRRFARIKPQPNENREARLQKLFARIKARAERKQALKETSNLTDTPIRSETAIPSVPRTPQTQPVASPATVQATPVVEGKPVTQEAGIVQGIPVPQATRPSPNAAATVKATPVVEGRPVRPEPGVVQGIPVPQAPRVGPTVWAIAIPMAARPMPNPLVQAYNKSGYGQARQGVLANGQRVSVMHFPSKAAANNFLMQQAKNGMQFQIMNAAGQLTHQTQAGKLVNLQKGSAVKSSAVRMGALPNARPGVAKRPMAAPPSYPTSASTSKPSPGSTPSPTTPRRPGM